VSDVNGEQSRVDFAGIQALSSRGAGYAVAAKCLQVQAGAEAQNPSLRTPTRVVLDPEARSWYVGALGEIAVGRMLTALGPGWFVRHAVPIGKGTKDIDHLVIGPAGVFVINTKHHAGASIWVGDHVLQVNGASQRHLAGALRDRDDVARRLTDKAGFPVPVVPVLAMFNPRSITDKRLLTARPVAVLNARELVAWLRSRPMRFSETELALIRLVAEDPESWHVDPQSADTLRVMQRFERLVALVDSPALATAPRRPTANAPAPSRRPHRTAPPRRVPSATGHKTPARKSGAPTAFGTVLKLWLSVGLIIAAVGTTTGFMSQPCSSPVVCAFVPLYLTILPILGLATLGLIGIATVASLRWVVRSIRHKKKD
jgi:hypothetical protein